MAKIFQGFTAKIFIGNIQVGCCSNVSVEINDNVENYYGIERTTPETIITEGTQEITGHIKRLWVNTYYLSLLGMNVTPFSWSHNVPFDLLLESSVDSSSPFLYLYNCRFKKATINIPVSGWIEEEYDFISLSSAVGEYGPPVPPIIPIEGSYFWNCSKPYYYNGRYYVFFQRGSNNLYYAKTNGSVWDAPILITPEPPSSNFHWSDMCVDNKVALGWGSVGYGGYIKMGTIQPDGSILFSANQLINTGSFALSSTISAIKIGGTRKFFYLNSGGPSSGDYLWISDDDGASWIYEGVTGSFGSFYWWNHRIIPYKDGNKFIQFTAPPYWGLNYIIGAKYRDPPSADSSVVLGSLNDEWYIYDKGEGTLRSVSDDVHVTWIDNSYNIQHYKANKSSPSVWTDEGIVDTVSSFSCGCSPCYDSTYDSIFIVYYEGNTIYYKRWIPFGGYGAKTTFYSGTLPIDNLCIYPESLDNRIVIAWNEYDSSTGKWYVKCSALLLGPTPPPEWNTYATIVALFQLSPTYFMDPISAIISSYSLVMCEGIEKINSIISIWEVESGLGIVLLLPIISTNDYNLDHTDLSLSLDTSKDSNLDTTDSSLSIDLVKDSSLDSVDSANEIASLNDLTTDSLDNISTIFLNKETEVGDPFTIEKTLFIRGDSIVRSTGIFVDIPDIILPITYVCDIGTDTLPDTIPNISISVDTTASSSDISLSIDISKDKYLDVADKSSSVDLSKDSYLDVSDKSITVSLTFEHLVS